MSGGLKWSREAMKKFVLHMFHPACFFIDFWSSQPCLDLIFPSPWQPVHLHSLLWKEPTHFANQHPLFACWTQPIPINLTRILHLHKEGQAENDTYNQNHYKLYFALFSLEHTLHCYLNRCFLLATSDTQIDAFYLSFSLSFFFGLQCCQGIQWWREMKPRAYTLTLLSVLAQRRHPSYFPKPCKDFRHMVAPSSQWGHKM